MPKQKDSSAALRSRTESSTDEIKNRLLRQTWARLALQQEKQEVRNPPREDRPRHSRGYAAGALEQSRWRNNSSPGPEPEDPCSPFLLRVKAQPPSQRHPGILNRGKTVSSCGYSGHMERTITCDVHLLQPTPKERLNTNTEKTYPKDVIITNNIYGCEANRNSKATTRPKLRAEAQSKEN